jgi:hypothetical protein
VKPDVPAAPVDSVYLNDSQSLDVPMVAATWTDFGGLRANYIFAYPRATNTTLTIDPSTFGVTGASYLHNYLTRSNNYIAAGSTYTTNLPGGASYFILVPVGASGITLLGDTSHFVTLGKQRIPALSDDGTLDVTVAFAAGETSRTLTGFSAQPFAVASVAGSHKSATWDSTSQMFTVVVHPSTTGVAHLKLYTVTVATAPAASSNCGAHCP